MTCESKAKQVLYRLAQDLTPTNGMYQNTLEKVATKEVIPWLGMVDFLTILSRWRLTRLGQTATFQPSTRASRIPIPLF
jgi:hypothetical protein